MNEKERMNEKDGMKERMNEKHNEWKKEGK